MHSSTKWLTSSLEVMASPHRGSSILEAMEEATTPEAASREATQDSNRAATRVSNLQGAGLLDSLEATQASNLEGTHLGLQVIARSN